MQNLNSKLRVKTKDISIYDQDFGHLHLDL